MNDEHDRDGMDCMSTAELLDLRRDVDRRIIESGLRDREAAIAAAEEVAAAHGFTLKELIRKPRKAVHVGPARYVHPRDASLTWSGVGRRPDWLKREIAGGASLDDLKAAG